jgi:CRP/FNR family transcriptional regulator, anaerobic regulatory protein
MESPFKSPLHNPDREISCHECPLRGLKIFRDFTPSELKFVDTFKTGELRMKAGATLLHEGDATDYLYTLLSGWMFRYKSLPDGRRQILKFVLPGDFVGLQASVFHEAQHTIETLSDAVLCVFPRKKLWSLYSGQPGLGYDVTWLAAREEKMLDDNLLSIGRRTALERMAYLIMHLYRRAKELRLVKDTAFFTPINQQHLADTLGLSIVHTNKTVRKLRERGVIDWRDKLLTVNDEKGLAAIANYEADQSPPRPII